ncbi:MAG: ABC transporter substrate-binding protein [Ardenticatenaceae bacterium]|nr:ABC transporter substrate-binding protein [Ardenticatenaceae bacterium]
MKKFKILSAFVILLLLLSACGTDTPPAEDPQQGEVAPEAEEETAEEMAEEPAEEAEEEVIESIGSAEDLADIAREDTLVMGWSHATPIGTTNPWAVPGYTHQDAGAFMWEGLSYFRIFADEEAPWLAESMEYNDDFTELTITLRPEAKWSDGTPVTSRDVVFTLEGQLNRDTLAYHAAFVQFVDSIEAVDDLTTVVTFNQPAPRFKFEVLTLKFDTGINIVPAHVLEEQEDIAGFAGGIEMPHSGPYSVVAWDNTQKILDLREDWWAVEAGLIDTPDVKRIVMVNLGGQVGANMEAVAQRIVNNEMDTALDFRQDIIQSIIEQNPAVTSHTGDQPPFGYLDWWPNSLWMNTLVPPYDDARVRRAVSLAVDRDTIDEIVYSGAQVTTIYPFPLYPGLENFVAREDVQASIETHDPRRFNLEESAALMEEAGYTMNGSGLWEKDGETVNATIHGFPGIHGDIVPVLEQMLLNAGFDATINFGDDSFQQMADGAPGLYMFGHGASLVDPYAALELFHGRFSESIGTTAGNNRFSRYSNPDYDAILDEMAPLDANDPRFQELAAQAIDIYWSEQIDVPVIQWLHRIAYNQTYWTNWPTADNLGPGVNGAFWAHTGMLVVTGLEKAE